MKNRIRLQILSMLMISSMLISVLCGCSQGTTTTAPNGTASTAGTPSAATAAEQTVAAPAEATAAQTASTLPIVAEKASFSLWTGLAPFAAQYVTDLNEISVFKELEKRTNIHIDFQLVSPETEREKFNLMIASGEYTDIINSAANLYTGGQDKAVSDKVLLNLTPLIEKDAPNYSAILKNDATLKKNVMTDAGNIVAFPNIFKEKGVANSGAVIRQDWLDELGLAMPRTYDDLYNVLKAFKEKKGCEAPIVIPANGVPSSNGLIAGYGVAGTVANGWVVEAPFYQVDGKVKFGPLEQGFEDYISMINKWYSEGLIYKDFMSSTEMNFRDEAMILGGKVGVFYGGVQDLAMYATKAEDKKFRLAAMPDMVKTVGDTLHLGSENSRINSMTWAISTTCKDPDTAVKWIDYLYSEEGSMLCNYGVEGEGYSLVDGKPSYTEKITKNADEIPYNIAQYLFAMGNANATPFVSDPAKDYVTYTEDQVNAASVWMTDNDGAYNISNYVYLTEAENGEFSQKFADITTYMNESIVKFITGAQPMSGFADFRAKLRS
ncbi:MAG: extracellular solute-binding protein, partial [Clostridiales bacterium]|nr:extracellular solute-binding protein [Clostridiales bacterium]